MTTESTDHSNNQDTYINEEDGHKINAEDILHQGAGEDTHTGEVHDEHEHTLYSEPLFDIGGFTVTNSLLTSWVAVFLIILLSVAIRKKTKLIPGAFQGMVETIIDGALGMMDLVTNDRDKSKKVFPIIFAIFIFVLINNWLGMFPGVGSITYDGTLLFRGATADLNTTLALGLFSVVAANVFGVMVVGGWNYFNKFVNIKAILEIPKKIIKEPTIVLVNPIHFFVGLIEIISEFAKIASLSFRLFGNVFAGEVLLDSISDSDSTLTTINS